VTGKKRPPRPATDPETRPATGPEARNRPSPSEEEARFIQALVARGEAARAIDGELPDGATHEIVEDEQGRITVVRRRFLD
jgi:hypothetical protein